MRDLLDPELCIGGPHPIAHNPSSNWKGCSNPPRCRGWRWENFELLLQLMLIMKVVKKFCA